MRACPREEPCKHEKPLQLTCILEAESVAYRAAESISQSARCKRAERKRQQAEGPCFRFAPAQLFTRGQIHILA